jgi:hypothetical protein
LRHNQNQDSWFIAFINQQNFKKLRIGFGLLISNLISKIKIR